MKKFKFLTANNLNNLTILINKHLDAKWVVYGELHVIDDQYVMGVYLNNSV